MMMQIKISSVSTENAVYRLSSTSAKFTFDNFETAPLKINKLTLAWVSLMIMNSVL